MKTGCRLFRTYAIHAILLSLILMTGFISCRKKDQVDADPLLKLAFSTDTVFFDTVFTSVGSVTKRLLVYNLNDRKLRISSVELAGGAASSYRININGEPAFSATDIEIPAGDSIFIFVRVTVDPTSQAAPLVITDSILFHTNGNLQDVKLVAWGQDAHFHKNAVMKGTVTWDSLKPHVVYGFVRIDTSGSLVILPGTKIYFHQGSSLHIAYDASLTIDGTLDHPVRFQGDRLDAFYRDLPGQWDGIYLDRGSRDNVINFAIIKNGNFGLLVDSLGNSAGPVLKIDNTIIQNMTGAGLYGYATKIISTNCVIGSCGSSSLLLDNGGYYDFRQLTVGNYWNSSVRFSPALYLGNYTVNDLGSKVPNPLEKAYFGNCIIYGSLDEEILRDSVTGAGFSYQFDHCLLETKISTASPERFISCIVNDDPVFVDVLNYNLAIDSISPAIDKGAPLGVPFDIRGIDRGMTPDLGAYQYVKR